MAVAEDDDDERSFNKAFAEFCGRLVSIDHLPFSFSIFFLDTRFSQVPGRLTFNRQGIAFSNTKTGIVTAIEPASCERVAWIRLGARYGIKLALKDGSMHRFGLFNETVYRGGMLFCS